MDNLEKEIIKRLNKVLNKYNLEIISKNNHNYKTTISIDDEFKIYCLKYNLVEIKDNTIIKCHLTWDNIEFMLLSSAYSYSFFNVIDETHTNINLNKTNGLEPYDESSTLLDKLYNELHALNDCSCLEELMIKMDLIGI